MSNPVWLVLPLGSLFRVFFIRLAAMEENRSEAARDEGGDAVRVESQWYSCLPDGVFRERALITTAAAEAMFEKGDILYQSTFLAQLDESGGAKASRESMGIPHLRSSARCSHRPPLRPSR